MKIKETILEEIQKTQHKLCGMIMVETPFNELNIQDQLVIVENEFAELKANITQLTFAQ